MSFMNLWVTLRQQFHQGKMIAYDVCVFATGSRAAIPPYIRPDDLDTTQGLFVYRTIDDLERMMIFATQKRVKKVAVVGGGLLGLEAAKAISELESVPQVSIIERNKWARICNLCFWDLTTLTPLCLKILCRQLDEEGGRMVLEQVRAFGIEVLCEVQVKSITVSDKGEPVATGLQLDNLQHFSCDMIVFAIGIRPRDEVAKTSGIEVDSRGGIVVGDDLRTSAQNVYGIGECASWHGKSYGFIAPCIEMADVLAYNLTKESSDPLRSMTTPDTSTKLKLVGVNVASFGDYLADKKDSDTVDIPGHTRKGGLTPVRALTYHDPFGPVYKKYIFSGDGKYLLGGMMVGDVNDYAKLLAIVKKRVSDYQIAACFYRNKILVETFGYCAQSINNWDSSQRRRI